MWMHKVIVYITVAVSILEYSILTEMWHNSMEGECIDKHISHSSQQLM